MGRGRHAGVGAPTEAEIMDKILRYEDAINALKVRPARGVHVFPGCHPLCNLLVFSLFKGAVLEGQVPGGGACYAYMLRHADECRALFMDPDEALAVDAAAAAGVARPAPAPLAAGCGRLEGSLQLVSQQA